MLMSSCKLLFDFFLHTAVVFCGIAAGGNVLGVAFQRFGA